MKNEYLKKNSVNIYEAIPAAYCMILIRYQMSSLFCIPPSDKSTHRMTGRYFAQTQIRELRVETETETESACEPNNKTNSHTQTKISYFNN